MPRHAFDRVAALERGGQVLLDRGAKRANLSGAQHRLRSSATIHPRVGGSVEKSPQGWEVHLQAQFEGPVGDRGASGSDREDSGRGSGPAARFEQTGAAAGGVVAKVGALGGSCQLRLAN